MQLLSKQYLHIPNRPTHVLLYTSFHTYHIIAIFQDIRMTLFQNTNDSFWVQVGKGYNTATNTYLVIYDKDE